MDSAATYELGVRYGTKQNGVQMQISVGTTVAISSVEVKNSDGYNANANATLGKIDLNAGENKIRFKVLENKTNSTVEWVILSSFTLTKVNDIFLFPMTKDTFSVEGASYNSGVSPAGFISSYMDMRDTNGGTNPTWVQAPITVTTAGYYGVSANIGTYASLECRMDAIALDSSESIKSRVSSSIPHTGGMSTYKDTYLGKIYLDENTKFIKLLITNGIANVKSFKISRLQDDLKDGSLDFLVRKDTVEIDNFISGGANLDSMSVQLRRDNEFSFKIYTEKALNYNIALKAGTTQSGQNINVTVNGYTQIVDSTISATSSYVPSGKQVIGNVYLNRGMNTIKINLGTTYTDPVFIERVYFDIADSFIDGYMTLYTQENRIPEYAFGTGSEFTTQEQENCLKIAQGTKLTYDVKTSDIQSVDVLADAFVGSEFTISAAVNGTTQITSASASVSDGSGFQESNLLGRLSVPEGLSTIVFTIESGNGYLKSIKLEPSDLSITQILSFGLENEDGLRVPYSVSEGIDIYGALEIKKFGVADDVINLFVAEYNNDGMLIGAKPLTIDVEEMESRETKTFRNKLTLGGDGGYVKAFVFDENLEPLQDFVSYEDAKIFTNEAIDTFKNTNVEYVKATTLETNTEGTYYQDTGIYTDDYTITPVFYDGYKDAKIFAYLGVPANATADNPVPAMVCVHGGNGQAYRTWVEHWVKRGFAAIAMDLYGCAPEGEYGWTYNEDQNYLRTPYVGNMNTSPWNASAYSKNGDFRQGAMYQNVANVMYAHNILRGIEGVDTSKIGITGVSWGGVTTTTTIGVDDRFAFAAPIYGCGYLDIGKGGFDTFYKYSDGTINWDPINFAAKSDIPILYLNGNNDQNFSALSSSYSVGVAKNGYLSIYNNLTHSQNKAESLEQVYRFAENMVNGTNPYIKINSTQINDRVLTIDCTIPEGTTLENAKMYYITDKTYPDITSYSSVSWKTVSEYTNNNGIVTMNVPDGATYLYVEMTDNNGDILCTKIIIL